MSTDDAPHRRLDLTAIAVVLVLVGAVGVWLLSTHTDAGSQAARPQVAPAAASATTIDARGVTARDRAPTGSEQIRAENAKPGNPEWSIEDGDDRPRGVEGFTDRVSGQQGDTVRLFVTTEAPTFQVTAYRLGHYGGAGARQVWQSPAIPGTDQPECKVEAATEMVDCTNWSPSLSVRVDDGWPGGQYLFKLVPASGSSSFVPYVVREDRRESAVLVVSDVTTLQAYNNWGGHSLYGGSGGRSTVVSYDRPMDTGWAMSGILGDSYNIGVMVESMGLDVSYTTNIDQHEQPGLMADHKAIITGVHDEYYSLEMRDGLEAARDSGVNVLFLGANAVYRRIRLEPSVLGPNRHQVNYRSAAADPLDGVDPARVTTSWREAPAARPESTLTGTYYECNEGGMRADMVIVDATDWMFAGTNVTTDQHWPEVVREEYDRVTPSAPTPSNIQVITHSPLTCRGEASFSDMAYYTSPGGAGVLNTGTLGFEPRLGPLCAPTEINAEHWECQLRQMIANVITEFAKGPAGVDHPSEPNLTALGIRN